MQIIAFVRAFFTPSTAKALSGFRKSIKQLHAVAALELAEEQRQVNIAARATSKGIDARDRYVEADRLATKFESFIA